MCWQTSSQALFKERDDVKEGLGDGAYDSARIYERLREKGIDAVIKPRSDPLNNQSAFFFLVHSSL